MRKNYIFGIFSKRKLSILHLVYQFPLDSFSNKKNIYKLEQCRSTGNRTTCNINIININRAVKKHVLYIINMTKIFCTEYVILSQNCQGSFKFVVTLCANYCLGVTASISSSNKASRRTFRLIAWMHELKIGLRK